MHSQAIYSMHVTDSHHDYLQTLLVAAHRLTRVAATSTGDTTSPAVWRTLSILRAEGPMRIGALAIASRVSQPTMTKLLGGLVEQEYVRRIADIEDSRAWLIALADAGRRALDAHRDALSAALAPLFAGLSATDRAALARAATILDEATSAREAVAS